MESKINHNMGRREWIMLLILSVLWGGSFFFVGVAVKELPPLTIVTLRVLFAALILWVVLLLLGYQVPKSVKVWLALFLMGMLNNVIPFSLIVWGQTHIASGLASILNATTPLFTVVIAGMLLTDERITAQKLVGIVIGFIGVVVLIGPSSLKGLGTHTLAQIAILGAAISYGLAGVYGRRFKKMGINPMIAAAGQVTASAILLLPIAIFIERPDQLTLPGIEVWLAIIGLVVFSTVLAYLLYFRILSSSGATNLLLVTFLIPVSVILLGSVVLGESLEVEHFIGMGFIGIGLSAIDGRIWDRIKFRLITIKSKRPPSSAID